MREVFLAAGRGQGQDTGVAGAGAPRLTAFMNGMNCRSCGLVNAPSDSSCERCGVPLSEGLPVTLPGAAGGAVSRVHRWDAAALAKALMAGAAAECAAAAP